VLSAVALPGLNNFVSEVMVLYGVFMHNWWLSALLGTTVILSILYMLRFMHSVYFSSSSMFQKSWIDITAKETLVALPVIALIVWLGVYPAPALDQIEPAAQKIIEKGSEMGVKSI
jgi:NADH-quinone oxidoreductase subunit M